MPEKIAEKADALNSSDLKKIGGGGLGVLAILFMFQEKGMVWMSEKQNARDEVVIEKTMANTNRINKLEVTVQNLNSKLDLGFNSIREQIRQDTSKLSDIMRDSSRDRFTKSEHMAYRSTIREELRRVDDSMESIKDRVRDAARRSEELK